MSELGTELGTAGTGLVPESVPESGSESVPESGSRSQCQSRGQGSEQVSELVSESGTGDRVSLGQGTESRGEVGLKCQESE